EPEQVGHARLDAEIVHLVVHHHAGARRREARAVVVVDRGRDRHGVAASIDGLKREGSKSFQRSSRYEAESSWAIGTCTRSGSPKCLARSANESCMAVAI